MARASTLEKVEDTSSPAGASVYSGNRTVQSPDVKLSEDLKLNTRLRMEGRKFLSLLPPDSFPIVFFDPQYRGILDKMNYGNEGKSRGRGRSELPQMTEDVIKKFMVAIDKILQPSGHLFLWTDKFHLCEGLKEWAEGTNLDIVDLITWSKQRTGMGYRTRRTGEHLLVLQKNPRKAKGIWKVHTIPDVWEEKISNRNVHPHCKPVDLQSELIRAVSNTGDMVIDPAAGSFSVMKAACAAERNFLGCDING